MDDGRRESTAITEAEREKLPPSASGGVLAEREQAKRLSLPLLLLLLLLLLLFFWLYLFGPGGRFGETLTPARPTFDPVDLVSSETIGRPAPSDDEEPDVVIVPGGTEVGDGHGLGAPGTRAGDIIIAPDPTTPAPPAITLTPAERAFEPNIMMGMNRVQEAIDYITRASQDGPDAVIQIAEKYRNVIDFNRNLDPVGRWVPIYNGFVPTIDRLEAAIDRIVGGDTGSAPSLMAGVQTSLDAARVPMNALVDGSSTY